MADATVTTPINTDESTLAERVTDAGAGTIGEPSVETVIARLNDNEVPLTDPQKRVVLGEALDRGMLFPREVARLRETGWLPAEPS